MTNHRYTFQPPPRRHLSPFFRSTHDTLRSIPPTIVNIIGLKSPGVLTVSSQSVHLLPSDIPGISAEYTPHRLEYQIPRRVPDDTGLKSIRQVDARPFPALIHIQGLIRFQIRMVEVLQPPHVGYAESH
jgi:hypothetical protein